MKNYHCKCDYVYKHACTQFCIRGYFAVVLFSRILRVSPREKFLLQFMAIYSNEYITTIMKLSHCEFPHLVQNHENICTRNILHIQYILPADENTANSAFFISWIHISWMITLVNCFRYISATSITNISNWQKWIHRCLQTNSSFVLINLNTVYS